MEANSEAASPTNTPAQQQAEMTQAEVPQAEWARQATAAGAFLLDDGAIQGNGESDPLLLGPLCGKELGVVLGIQESVEQQSLELTIWGSSDGQNWGSAPLLHFPQKFYVGVSELLLDLSTQPQVTLLKAKWTANRWGRGSTTPAFRAYVFLRPA
jgi:hypothetical protein